MEETERKVEMVKEKKTINERGGGDGGFKSKKGGGVNADSITRLGGAGAGSGGIGGSGYGSSKTHNFFQSENQILEMTGLISVLSEPGSRREGDAGGLSATICQGKLETIRAE